MRLFLLLCALLAPTSSLKVAVRQLSILQEKFNCDTGTVAFWNPCDVKVKVCAALVEKGKAAPKPESSDWECTEYQILDSSKADAGSSLDGSNYKDVFNFRDCFRDDSCQFHIPQLEAGPNAWVATKWSLADFDDDNGTSGDGDDLLLKDWIIQSVPATTAGDVDLPPNFEECHKDEDENRFCDSVRLFFHVIPDPHMLSPAVPPQMAGSSIESARNIAMATNRIPVMDEPVRNAEKEVEDKSIAKQEDDASEGKAENVDKSNEQDDAGAGEDKYGITSEDKQAISGKNQKEDKEANDPKVKDDYLGETEISTKKLELPEVVEPGMDANTGEAVARKLAKGSKAKKEERQKITQGRKADQLNQAAKPVYQPISSQQEGIPKDAALEKDTGAQVYHPRSLQEEKSQNKAELDKIQVIAKALQAGGVPLDGKPTLRRSEVAAAVPNTFQLVDSKKNSNIEKLR